MAHIRIKNWEQYQHYKDRNPPWIKLHNDLISSRTWVSLDDASRVLAIACMLLASRTENKIPYDMAYLQRVAYLHSLPDIHPLLEIEFVEIIGLTKETVMNASAVLANRSECLPRDRDRAEQSRAEKEKPLRSAPRSATGQFAESIYAAYPRKVAKGDALKAIRKAVNKIAKEKQLGETEAADYLQKAVTEYSASPDGHRGEFTPHCATWMNRERWNDDRAEWKRLAPVDADYQPAPKLNPAIYREGL